MFWLTWRIMWSLGQFFRSMSVCCSFNLLVSLPTRHFLDQFPSLFDRTLVFDNSNFLIISHNINKTNTYTNTFANKFPYDKYPFCDQENISSEWTRKAQEFKLEPNAISNIGDGSSCVRSTRGPGKNFNKLFSFANCAPRRHLME